jgi:outer membrane lipoprotein LolB
MPVQTLSRLIFALICLSLVSCAMVKEKSSLQPEGWLEQQEQRQQIKIWEVRGRLGVQTQATGGSMDLIWKQSGEDYTIRLILPLGSGSYLIQGDEQYAVIRYPDGRKESVRNIDNVFSSALGVSLPVNAVRDWVRGLPARYLPVEEMQWDDQGLLNTVQQSGWTVEMTDYSGSDLLLPHEVYLSRIDDESLDIRLLLKQWRIEN